MHPRYRRIVLLHATPEERVDEDPTELLAERAIQDEVDGAVEIHEKVADVREDHVAEVVSDVRVVDGVGEVVDEGGDLTHDEDHDDGHEHDRDAVLPVLPHIHVLALSLRVSDGEDEEEIEDEENEERHDAHDGNVQPREVHLQVDGVLAERRARRDNDRRVGRRVHVGRRGVVEPARDVVEGWAERHARDDGLGARDRAHRRGLEWVTHRDVAFDRERHRQPDGRGLRDQGDRVDVGDDVREDMRHVDGVVWQRAGDTDQ